jgi:hypothetical protein
VLAPKDQRKVDRFILFALDYAICNGFGFGGVNASALFQRWTDKLADASAACSWRASPRSVRVEAPIRLPKP